MSDPVPVSRALALIKLAGGPRNAQIVTLPGGANNRVCRVEGDGSPLLLKVYFRETRDQRDRLRSEFEFLRYAWQAGLRCVPRPLGRDDDAGLGLYEYIEGESFAAGDVETDHVEQAATFVEALNAPATREGAHTLPIASEACFSIGDHIARVSARVSRLNRIVERDEVDATCARFVAEELVPVWHELAGDVTDRAASHSPALSETLPQTERVVSPSDFGFHNALRTRDGVRFLDFEYAGWDDPAKLVCDFFCQVHVPVPREHLARMMSAATRGLSNTSAHEARARLLLPVYGVKWCCILLNDFLEPGRARRRFALGEAAARERRGGQLEKAKRLVARLQVATSLG